MPSKSSAGVNVALAPLTVTVPCAAGGGVTTEYVNASPSASLQESGTTVGSSDVPVALTSVHTGAALTLAGRPSVNATDACGVDGSMRNCKGAPGPKVPVSRAAKPSLTLSVASTPKCTVWPASRVPSLLSSSVTGIAPKSSSMPRSANAT